MDSTTDSCSVPELVEPVINPEQADAAQPGAAQPEAANVEPLINPEQPETANAEPVVSPDRPETVYREIIRATHWWVLYGSGGFAVLCILIGALEGLFSR